MTYGETYGKAGIFLLFPPNKLPLFCQFTVKRIEFICKSLFSVLSIQIITRFVSNDWSMTAVVLTPDLLCSLIDLWGISILPHFIQASLFANAKLEEVNPQSIRHDLAVEIYRSTDGMGDSEDRRRCLRPGLGCVVMVWVLVATVALTLSYSIARSTGHVSPFVPAISDTTSKNPEGAIFAELFNATAVLTLMIMAVRYYQVKMINRQVEGGESSHLSQLNVLSVVFGIGSALGASIVANFRSLEVSLSL